jgi:hypothetical protein
MRARRFCGQRKKRFSKPALTYLKRQFRCRYKTPHAAANNRGYSAMREEALSDFKKQWLR